MEKEVKLIHQNNSKFPLLISDKLERKIRVLCNKFPLTEWSGQLFYTYSGSFEKGDIQFVAEDLLFMDTGNGVNTEFYLDEGNTAAYIADHELWNCQVGLIHSHHNMGAFFSGQDDAMLLQEGKARNHFLSLVVDNKGTYVAKVTIKEVYNSVIKTSLEYRTYNDIAATKECEEVTETKTVVSTYNLDITNHNTLTCDDYDELMETIKKCDTIKQERIKREKEEKGKEKAPFWNPSNANPVPYNKTKKVENFPEFPGFEEFADFNEFNEFNELKTPSKNPSEDDIPEIVLSENRIEFYAAQMLTLGFLHTSTKGIHEYLSKMDSLMQDRFEGKLSDYESIVSLVCDYLIDDILVAELSDLYHPRILDDALTQAKLQISEYFENLMLEYQDKFNVCQYLEIIHKYLNF